MKRVSSLLTGCLFVLAVTEAERFFRPGRRVCSAAGEGRTVSFLVSHAHPVYQPYLTVCQGQRLCSTYSTTYRVSHRQAYRTVSQPAHRCCPGWRRASGHAWLGCDTAVCQPPCQNGGKCSLPNTCTCPAGWTGRCCQTDVDECAGGRHGCSQSCLNVAGSYSCTCQQGHKLQADGKTCQASEAPTDVPGITSPAGASNLTVQEDVAELRRRVLALEEKLQLALAPFLSLGLPGPESVSSNALGLLLHVWQQVDRVDSLSEQISFLEEQLETCTCQPEHGGRRSRKRSPPS
ncbi:PREDICTED: epidermal growth factor-like protein 7 isoform X2 [Gekko japonicus]|uniref:Epidermal growth factor-like protein 7 isoform X2 n=1 Tax=Gekko japonicus TaxID=146911 RepID=A0ABM1K7M2_GEKJA|nr:PREDICTED: epidermal growth factor-like protein 7 isoform X2 [Gekko japonicus]